MTDDPRAALSALVAALETHLETAAVRRGDNDPSVLEAYDRIVEAFSAYDDALMDAYGEVTPLVVYGEDSDDDDDDEFDEFDDADDADDADDDDDDDGEDTDEAVDGSEDDVDTSARG